MRKKELREGVDEAKARKELRAYLDKGNTQLQLSKDANCSRHTIRKWLNKEQTMSFEIWDAIALVIRKNK